MTNAPFQNLRAQTLIVLIIGLLVSHAIGFLLYALDRRAAVATTEAFDIAERASGVVILLRNVSDDWRPDILAASDSRSFRVWQTDESTLDVAARSTDDKRVLDYLRTLLPRLAERDMHVVVTPPPLKDVRPPTRPDPPGAPTINLFDSAAEIVGISIHHPDGFWLNFVGVIPKPASIWPGVIGGYLLSVVIGAAVISFWLVRRVTQPLADFAAAAERLGKDIRSEPLPHEGPGEVVQVALAFNRMQDRIAKLLEHRMELLAAISHDLRTPVTQMKLRAELLENKEDQEKFIKALGDMEVIIATFHDYARSAYGSEARSRIEFGSLVESVCSDMADAGEDVVYESDERVYFECKRVAVKRALNNLIDNAVKYGLRARVWLTKEKTRIVICIDDDGPGIPPDELDKAFLPFHRFESSRSRETGGIGLGLSIAQAVAHDHGGDIKLLNRMEGGLRVEFVLPS